MSTALYRRYRPQTFADVIGQEHVTEPLMQALRTGRTGHAYLFSGPRGCGKTTSARILARCLNCEQGPTPTPCGSCPSCIALSAGGPGSVDVIEIDAASHGGVDDARDLRERAAYGPAQSRYKVYIIDEAHMVTPQGFNALLKIVEEPPAHVKFVFATTEPEKVIGTIRSRTHHYPFRLVPPARLTTYLEQLCALEKVPVEPGVLSFVVRAGGGSVRDSLSVLDQLIAGSADSGLTYAGAAALLGFTEVELLDAVVEAFAAQDGGAVFRQIDKVVETGQDPRRFVEDLLERFRDLIIVAASTEGADAVLRGLPEDQMHRLRQQAVSFGAAELSRCADLVNTGLTQMNGVTSPRLQLELICARLLLPAVSGAEGHGARLDRLERRLDAAGPLPSAPVGDIPTSGGSAVPAPGGDIPAEERPLPPAVSGARGREALRRARAAVREADGTATAAGNDRPAPESVAPEPAVREEAPPARPRPEAPRPEPTRPEAHRPEPAGPPTGASPAADRAPGTDRPDVDALRRSWPDVLAAILPLRKATWFLLAEHAQVMEADGERVVLGFANPGLVRAFHQGGHADVVGQAVHQTLGLRARVEGTTLPPSGPDGHPGHGGGGPGPRNGPGTGDPGGPDPAAPRRQPDAATRPGPVTPAAPPPDRAAPSGHGRGPSVPPPPDYGWPDDRDIPPDEDVPPDPWEDPADEPAPRPPARPGPDMRTSAPRPQPAPAAAPAAAPAVERPTASAPDPRPAPRPAPAEAAPTKTAPAPRPTPAAGAAPAGARTSSGAAPTGGRMSGYQRAKAALHQAGDSRAAQLTRSGTAQNVPAPVENEDPGISEDDETVEDMVSIGQPVIARILGGVVIDEYEG